MTNKLFCPGIQYDPFAPEPTSPFLRFAHRSKHQAWCHEQLLPEDVVFNGYEGNILEFPAHRLVGHAPRVEVARLLHVTFFKDRFATSLKTRDMTLALLRDLIEKTNASEKSELPWLKLAKFGDKRTKKKSLRHDANVIEFDGIELDYDQKVMPIDNAIAILKKAKLLSLVYTSPSYMPAAPKWRILLPTSKSLPPEMRLQLAKQVSRLFGDVFSAESFTLSQSFYYGSVKKNPDHRAEIIDGDYIDLCGGLDAGEKAKTTLTREDRIKIWDAYLEREKKKFTRDDIAEHFENIRTGAEFHIATRTISMHLVKAGTHPGAVVKLLRGLMNNSETPRNERWKARFDDIPRTVEGAEEECKQQEEEEQTPEEGIVAEAHTFPDEATMEKDDWVLGRHLLRGEVAGTAAAGGTGKSTLGILEALVMASAKQLTHDDPPKKPLRVVLINLEDKRNIMNKRIAAAMRHHNLTPEDIGDRLIVLAKGEIKFKIARQVRGMFERNDKAIELLSKLMIEKQADVLSIDSFIRSHSVAENANEVIEQVIECFEDIAEAANCTVHLWHHTRKGRGEAATVESARGAQAFIDACRSVRILETMNEQQGDKLGVDNYRQFFRVFSGKRNFAPQLEDSKWFHIEDVILNNGKGARPQTPEQQERRPKLHYTIDGDHIGVVETWEPPEAKVTEENVADIKKILASGEWRESVQAAMWAGKGIAKVLNLDPDDDKEQIKKCLKKLIREGVLKTIPGRTVDRKPCLFIVPEDWTAPVIKLDE